MANEPTRNHDPLGLSLWQPWASCIAYHGKWLENRDEILRTWEGRPTLGRLVAIHAVAGKKPTADVEAHVVRNVNSDFALQLDTATLPRSAVVAVARIMGYVHPDGRIEHAYGASAPDRVRAAERSDWYAGPCAYILDEIVPLLWPAAGPGGRRFWRLPPGMAGDVRMSVEASALLARAAERKSLPWAEVDRLSRTVIYTLDTGFLSIAKAPYNTLRLTVEGEIMASKLSIRPSVVDEILRGSWWSREVSL